MSKRGFTLINFLRKTINVRPNGFTLIELLVTLTIIVILTMIGFLTFREVLRGARDAKRQSDLQSVRSSLEQYRADLTFYPVDSAFVSTMNTLLTSGSALTSNSALGNGAAPASLKTYLNKLPLDPNNPTTRYCYAATPVGCDNSATKCTGYTLYAQLEKTTGVLSCAAGGTGNYSLAVTPP